MSLITGGKILSLTFLVIVLMLIALGAMFIFSFDLGGLLSISVADLTSEEQVNEEPISSPEIIKDDEVAVDDEVVEIEELNSEEARQLLGFIDYPVLKLHASDVSVFSPLLIAFIPRLSEPEIAERCSHVTISFNHASCIQAETACADILKSDDSHWDCMAKNGYAHGKPL